MNKKLMEMLAAINAQKKTVMDLVNAGNLAEAKAAKEKLIEMQTAFDLVKDVEDTEPVNTKPVKDTVKDSVKAFAAAARRGFKNLDSGINQEGSDKDGGYTVPEDIQTRVQKWREEHFSLQSLVASETVSTASGRRTFQKRKKHSGFTKVGEGAKIGIKAGPEFEVRSYNIDKYAGAIPVTNELLEDSDENITNTLVEWLGEEDIATRNTLILEKVADKEAETFEGVDDIKKAVNVTLGQAFAGLASIVTNDDGLQYLDTLKDGNNRYLLQSAVDPAKPMEMVLAIGAKKIPVTVVPNSVLTTDETLGIPFIVGSLKDYVRIFDRKKMTLKASDTATVGDINAYEQDMTLIRAIERLDAVVYDTDAIVRGYIAVEADGAEGTTEGTTTP